jgi:hypothetical protein
VKGRKGSLANAIELPNNGLHPTVHGASQEAEMAGTSEDRLASVAALGWKMTSVAMDCRRPWCASKKP